MHNTLERLRERRANGESGFTLIELLIVIVILGILAAIVVFAVQNLSGQSSQSACSSDYKSTETALEAYKAQLNNYPASLSALTATGTDSTGATVGPWLKELPANSAAVTTNVSGAHYYFVYTPTPTGGPYTGYGITIGENGAAIASCSAAK